MAIRIPTTLARMMSFVAFHGVILLRGLVWVPAPCRPRSTPEHKAEGGKVQTEFWRKKECLSCLGRGPCGRIDEAPPPPRGEPPPATPCPVVLSLSFSVRTW